MAAEDICCSIVPYFKVSDENGEEFKKLCQEMVERSRKEPDCLYYGFSFGGNEVHCREGYKNAEALLYHIDNVSDLLERATQLAELSRMEIHGPKSELEKLRGPLEQLTPKYFELEYGFRR